jgi:hypothetical protein
MKGTTFAALLLAFTIEWPAAAVAGEIPRTASGRPDLSGNYDISNLTPFSRPKEMGNKRYFDPEDGAAIAKRMAATIAATSADSAPDRAAPEKGADVGAYNYFWLDFGTAALPIDGKIRTSVIIDPPNGQMPAITDAGKKRRHGAPQYDYYGKPRDKAWWMETGDRPYDDPESFTLGIRCIYLDVASLPMRSLPYNNVKTIVQTEDHVMILVEWMSYARIVRLGTKDEKPSHLPSSISAWSGDSIGWWEGDTLVVDTTNIREYPGALREGLRIEERFTPVADQGLVYKFTVQDPEYVSSYTGEMAWPRTDQTNYEYACHEGNYSMGSMLRGARMLEKEWVGKRAE